jgi:inner membrane protease subunit 2
MLVTFR